MNTSSNPAWTDFSKEGEFLDFYTSPASCVQHWERPADTSSTWISIPFTLWVSRYAYIKAWRSRFQALWVILKRLRTLFECKQPHTLLMRNRLLHRILRLRLFSYTRKLNTFRVGTRNKEVWILMGIILRLAMRMGYQRDADDYPKIFVFKVKWGGRYGPLYRNWIFGFILDGSAALVGRGHSGYKASSQSNGRGIRWKLDNSSVSKIQKWSYADVPYHCEWVECLLPS